MYAGISQGLQIAANGRLGGVHNLSDLICLESLPQCPVAYDSVCNNRIIPRIKTSESATLPRSIQLRYDICFGTETTSVPTSYGTM
jgi:hypothetical protein